ncbi:hypothetical protein [Halosimplex amylolyticum]|uniref:hypothetical protein n=1 Tax=Halosimplex amylolyticum TaxID=3396616 RepID=UPI003F574574
MEPEYAGLYGPPYEEGELPEQTYLEDWRDKIFEVVDGYRSDLIYFDFGIGLPALIKHDEYRREVVAYYYKWVEERGKEVGVAHGGTSRSFSTTSRR